MLLDRKRLGQRVKKAREARHLTQTKLAAILRVTHNYICSIERSHSVPSLEIFVKLCNALNVTPDYLLMDSVNQSHEYIKDELAVKIRKCTPSDMRLLSRFIDILIEEQE